MFARIFLHDLVRQLESDDAAGKRRCNSLVVENKFKAFQQNIKANLGKAPGASAKDLLADIDVGLHIKNKQQTK